MPNGSLPSLATRLASQLQEVSFDSNPTVRTPRLCIGYQEDDSSSPLEKTARYTSIDQANSGQTQPPKSTSDSQPNNAHPGSNVCDFSSSTVYSPSTVVLQVPDSQDGNRLGQISCIGPGEPSRAIMVVQQSQEMERSLHSSNDADAYHLCGRQQHRLGLQLEPTLRPWLLASTGSRTIHQLEGTQSSFSPPRTLHNPDSNGQDYQHDLHQQARRNSLSGIIGSSNRSLGLVSPAQDNDRGTTHQRSEQHDS